MALQFQNDKLLFIGGNLAVDSACCCNGESDCGISWTFTDEGFIAGGQDGAHRAYATPGSVSASPWTILTAPDGLRLDFEDSADDEPRNTSTTVAPRAGPGHGDAGVNCASYNHFNQLATASGTFTLASAGYIRIEWEGLGEVEDDYFEIMRLSIDGTPVSYGHSPGGYLGCADPADIVTDADRNCFYLASGAHTIDVVATTADSWYHVDCYYQFRIQCGVGPCGGPDNCCNDTGGGPTASFTVTELENCIYELVSTSTPGTCSETLTCEWTYRVQIADNIDATYVDPVTSCTREIDLSGCQTVFTNHINCDDIEAGCGTDPRVITISLKVTDGAGCTSVAETEVECSNSCPGVSGDLSYTLSEEFTCQWTICASVTDNDCTGTAWIEYQIIDGPSSGGDCIAPTDDYGSCDCNDLDLAPESCNDCSRSLGDGDCTTITVSPGASIRWRVWDRVCGCPSDWVTEDLPCNDCECCDDTYGDLESLDITIGGVAGGTSGVCADCLAFNDVYHVPITDPCFGSDTFEGIPTLCSGLTPQDEIFISWTITCEDLSTTLTVQVRPGPNFPAFVTFEKTVAHASGEKIDCSTLGGSLTQTACTCDGSSEVRCESSGMTASVVVNLV